MNPPSKEIHGTQLTALSLAALGVVFGDIGYARGVYTTRVTPKSGGAPSFVDGKFLTVYRRQADGRGDPVSILRSPKISSSYDPGRLDHAAGRT